MRDIETKSIGLIDCYEGEDFPTFTYDYLSPLSRSSSLKASIFAPAK